MTNAVNVAALGSGPAFSASLSTNTTITTGAFTKVTLDIENFDTNNNFTSSRFTPTIAGYYQINFGVDFQASTSVTRGFSTLYKNGSEFIRGTDVPSSIYLSTGSTVVYMNGSTDYIELYTYINAATPVVTTGSALTQMSGCMIRSA